MSHSSPPAELLAAIAAGRRFFVTSHQRPDGDAVGSAVAMALALQALGKDATVVFDARLPAFLEPFPHTSEIRIATSVTERVDAVLVMECSTLERTGVGGLEHSPVFNIDHHPGNARYGAVNWVDEGAAACAELVFTLIDALGVALTPAIATHLYLAILTDTGSFRFSHLTPRTYELAGRTVNAGADPQWIARTHYDSNSLARVRIFGAVLNAMSMHADGSVAVLSITQALAHEMGGTYDDTEGLINFPLTVKTVQAVAFFKEMGPDDWRVSLRSKGPVETGAIAREFGGGGHTNASGCAWKGTLDEGRETFARLLERALPA